MEYCKQNFANELEKQIKYCPENMETVFINTYKEIDNQLDQMSAREFGATCTSLLIRKENGKKVIYIANVGDSRAVLVGREQPLRLTFDHKGNVESEQQRIEESGGIMIGNRTGGMLAITRALGDFSIKKVGLICDPFYQRVEVTQQDKYIVIASDGIWDVIQDDELPTLIQKEQNVQENANKLLELTLSRESSDNLSIIMIQL